MKKRIGEYLVDKGVLTPVQVEKILAYGKQEGLRFGEAGLELGILTREMLLRAFGPNFLVDFFHLAPEFFPEVTRELFSVEQALNWGALPLGFKTVPGWFRSKKMLNVGFLNPARQDAVQHVEKLARERLGDKGFAGVKPYLLLADEFLAVMEKVYATSPEAINRRDPSSVDDTLKLFLDASPTSPK